MSAKVPNLNEVPAAITPQFFRGYADTSLAWMLRDFIASTHKRINELEAFIDLYAADTGREADRLYAQRLRHDLKELRESLRLCMSTGTAATRRRYDAARFTREEVKRA